MKTLIVAATYPEVSLLCEHFQLVPQELMQSEYFDVLITGVGMTATAFALGKYLDTSYHLVLNIGIAGSYKRKFPPGTLVQVIADTFSELGAESPSTFIPIEQMGFGKSTYQELADPGNPVDTGFKKVNGITVNQVHGCQESIEAIQQRLDPDVESMEGAAVFYACNQYGLPCLQIRSVSNYVTPRNTSSWEISKAIHNLNEWAITFLTIA